MEKCSSSQEGKQVKEVTDKIKEVALLEKYQFLKPTLANNDIFPIFSGLARTVNGRL